MRVIVILFLAGLLYWSMMERWGIIAMFVIAVIGVLIKTDKNRSIDSFFALGLLVTVIGGTGALVQGILN